jgi:hypothetical protein
MKVRWAANNGMQRPALRAAADAERWADIRACEAVRHCGARRWKANLTADTA